MRKLINARPLTLLLTIAAACIISLIAGPALASTAAPATAPALDFGLFTPLAPLLFTGLSAAGIAALTFAAKYMKNKSALVKNEQVRTLLDLIASMAFAKVLELFKGSIETLKTASEDGKLTKEEADAALQTAIREVWAAIPQIGRALLSAIAGGEKAAQDAFVKPRVEVAVNHQPPVLKPARVDYQVGNARRMELTVDGATLTSISPLPGGRLPTVQEILEARRRIGLPTDAQTAADLANRAAELVRHAN